MKIIPLLGVFLSSTIFAFAEAPVDPYSPQKPKVFRVKGAKVTVLDRMVGTDPGTNQRIYFISYIPSNPSVNMWDQIVEMYDVASLFLSCAKDEKATRIGVRPILNKENTSSSSNTAYYYLILDSGLPEAEWRLEWQPWFRNQQSYQGAAADHKP